MKTSQEPIFYNKISDEWVVLDRERGAWYGQLSRFQGERARRPGWVECLVISMKRGEFNGDLASTLAQYIAKTGT